MSKIKLEDFLNMDIGDVIDWLQDNAHKFDMVPKVDSGED
jgi:flagellar motor switch protein FliM